MSRPAGGAAPVDVREVQFEVFLGRRRVKCTLADEALEAVSGQPGPLSLSAKRSVFDRFRTLIDAAARLKMESLVPGSVQEVTLTSGDLRRAGPQVGAPPFGTAARVTARPVPLVA